MNEILSELQEFRREIDKIKEFCGLVAAEHNHIPHLNRRWYGDAGNLIYKHNKPWFKDLNQLSIIMRRQLLELEGRINELEQKSK